MFEKIDKKVIGICLVSVIVIMFVVGIVGLISSKKQKNVSDDNIQYLQSDLVKNNVSSETENATGIDSDSDSENSVDTETDNDIDDVIQPIDCNRDFWAIKYGIAECCDHIFEKGHMKGNVYYQGECDEHEPTEINELARIVKLYRSESGVYTAVLPKIGWKITIFDEKLQKIIDSQINGDGEAYPPEEISIVMFFSENDNSLYIEMKSEE